MNKIYQIRHLFTPIILGLVGFFAVTGGYIFHPTNISWLGGGFDPTTHYLGWEFYRLGPWEIPLGLNPNYGLEFSNSIVFSDSIPLLAVIFKALESLFILSLPFQYLGIWTFICFVLQAYFAWLLIGIFSKNYYFQLFGTVLFLFSPPMLARIGNHTALVAHFLIVMALYLYFSKESKFKVLKWLSVVGIAALTHFYLLVMVLLVWGADLIDRNRRQNSLSLKSIILEIAAILTGLYFLMWQAGYFSIDVGSAAARGYGFFRMNLLSLLDSRGWSYVFKAIPMPTDFGDGFNYFGLGGLWLFAFGLFAALKRKISFAVIVRPHYALIVLCIFLTLFAITNNIGFGNKIFIIPLPDWVIALASNLRGAGRMFWPVYYCLLLATLYIVMRAYPSKHLFWILLIAASLQIIDTSAGWLKIRKGLVSSTGSELHTPLKSKFWVDAASQYKKVIRVPAQNIANRWEVFADYAAKNKQATNFAFLSRVDQEKLDDFNRLILSRMASGSVDKDSLYIFENWKLNPIHIKFNSSSDLLGYVDGYVFLAPEWQLKSSEKEYGDVKILDNLAPKVNVGEVIDFSKKGNGREMFLLDGWGYSEDWGTWSDGSLASMRLPIPAGRKPSFIEINLRAFVAPGHATQYIEVVINGAIAQSAQLSSFESNILRIPLTPEMQNLRFITLEVKLKNPALAMQFGGTPGDARMLGVGIKSMVYR
jgi:hypothetical protein